METEVFSWLHLTDFHFGLQGQKFLWPNLRDPFLRDLEDLRRRTGPWHAVLFTGDLVQQGKSGEFREMQKDVLDRLWQKLKELDSGDAVLLAVPGNHDLYRPDAKVDNPALDTLLEKDGFVRIASKFWDNPASAYRSVVTDAFAAYTEWWKADPRRPESLQDGIIPGDFACTLDVGSRRIGIVGLNTAFLQLQGGDYQGKLVWDARQLHTVCGGAVDDWSNKHHVCLLLTHQDPGWLTTEAREHGENEIAPLGRFAAHFCGHMHKAKIEYVSRGGSQDTTRLCQGCSAFGMELFGEPPKMMRSHGYTAGHIEFGPEDTLLRLWPRVATSKTGPWRFIPDYERGHLLDDHGTPPQKIVVRHLGAPPGTDLKGPESSNPSAYSDEIASQIVDLIFPDARMPQEALKQEVTRRLAILLHILPKFMCVLRDSVILRFELPRSCIAGLMKAISEGQLADLGLVEARLVPDRERLLIQPEPPSVSTPFTAHSTLPSRRPFFGREKELGTIDKLLRPEHRGWGVVLDGPGGIGKTALALEAAHLAPAERYPLKLFITAKGDCLKPEGRRELQDHHVHDYSSFVSEIGLALGRDDISRGSPEQQANLVRHMLDMHRVLLVLDNLESVTYEDRRRLFDLLDVLPGSCRAIVTTRRRDETAARTLRLDKLGDGALDQLLDSLSEKWPSIASLTPQERHQLCDETGGNPLLLTWTASQLNRTQGRCRTMKDAIAFLQEANRLQKVDEENDPLEFVFSDVLDTANDDEMEVLTALARAARPMSMAELLPKVNLNETNAITAIEGLYNRALLIKNDAASTWSLSSLTATFVKRRIQGKSHSPIVHGRGVLFSAHGI